MKANTSREHRFDFDQVAEIYDRGRPAFDREFVTNLRLQIGLKSGDRVLEIGAGTGQLTGSLIRSGLQVVALEPGNHLAEVLRRKPWAAQGLQVIESTFEDFQFQEPFAAIFAANSFHWLDPQMSYRKAYAMLPPGGSLCLIWTFPILADANRQQYLNDNVFQGELRDHQRQPQDFIDNIRQMMAQGRVELITMSPFPEPVTTEIITQTLEWNIDRYVDFLTSFATAVNDADILASRIHQAFGREKVVTVNNTIAINLARKNE